MNTTIAVTNGNLPCFKKGIRDGLPISMGYMAVAVSFGIAAKNAGLTPFQATLMSLVTNTSAGEFAALGLIGAGASYLEMAMTQLIINIRYLLMSCALSQKIAPRTSMLHRCLLSYDITDEIFGVSVGAPGRLNPFYTYGMMATAIPCWALGTCMGVLLGCFLPARIVGALNVALYGMFLAVILPPARENHILAGIITISMGASLLFAVLPALAKISAGIKIMVLTVLIAGAAAILFPVYEEEPECHVVSN